MVAGGSWADSGRGRAQPGLGRYGRGGGGGEEGLGAKNWRRGTAGYGRGAGSCASAQPDLRRKKRGSSAREGGYTAAELRIRMRMPRARSGHRAPARRCLPRVKWPWVPDGSRWRFFFYPFSPKFDSVLIAKNSKFCTET